MKLPITIDELQKMTDERSPYSIPLLVDSRFAREYPRRGEKGREEEWICQILPGFHWSSDENVI